MNTAPHRTLSERLFHAATFEAIAVVLCAPVIGWAMAAPISSTGALTLAISIVAMLWNLLFSAIFDAAQRRWRFDRTLGVRVVHAVLFEAGLAAATVPMAAAWLSISLWQALLLDAAILLFFLPYTVVFNTIYDAARERWMQRLADDPLRAPCR